MVPAAESRPDGLGDRAIRVSRVVAEAAIVAMMLLIVVDIFCRSVLDISLLVSDEISGYMLVLMTFFGAADALRHGALLRIEIVLSLFGARQRAALNAIFDVLALGLTLVVLWQVSVLTWSTWNRRMVAPTLLETPLWVPQLAMPLGCALLAFAFILELHDHARVALKRNSESAGGDGR